MARSGTETSDDDIASGSYSDVRTVEIPRSLPPARPLRKNQEHRCPIPDCEVKFTRYADVLRHHETIHTLPKSWFVCQEIGCSRRSKQKGHALRHCQKVHSHTAGRETIEAVIVHDRDAEPGSHAKTRAPRSIEKPAKAKEPMTHDLHALSLAESAPALHSQLVPSTDSPLRWPELRLDAYRDLVSKSPAIEPAREEYMHSGPEAGSIRRPQYCCFHPGCGFVGEKKKDVGHHVFDVHERVHLDVDDGKNPHVPYDSDDASEQSAFESEAEDDQDSDISLSLKRSNNKMPRARLAEIVPTETNNTFNQRPSGQDSRVSEQMSDSDEPGLCMSADPKLLALVDETIDKMTLPEIGAISEERQSARSKLDPSRVDEQSTLLRNG